MKKNPLKEIARYCAANIEDWDLKSDMALRMIGRRMPIDPGFRNEIEDKVSEWCDDHDVCHDEVDWEDAAEEILWAEC